MSFMYPPAKTGLPLQTGTYSRGMRISQKTSNQADSNRYAWKQAVLKGKVLKAQEHQISQRLRLYVSVVNQKIK